ncbi:hypothetical protein [Terribacillus sp. DMT04]|nr:hypothetical protein [Terribacillus sp. DMT04]QXE02849.1 hypothetical protein KS242_06630 [Terribacillus sp. DMT04]
MTKQLDQAIRFIDKTLNNGLFDPLARQEMLRMKQQLERASKQGKSP